MNEPLLDLFESLMSDFGTLTLDQFTEAIQNGGKRRFKFSHAVIHTPLLKVSTELCNYQRTATDTTLPKSLRNDAFAQLKYKLEETIEALRIGSISTPRKKIPVKVVNRITDNKIKQFCIEINGIPDQHVLALSQLIGETLKWTVWYKAKQNNTQLQERTGLQPLLNEAIQQSYFTGNVAKRFLKEFRDNFMKASYDMIRHSDTYIPDITILNPQVDAIQVLLEECF